MERAGSGPFHALLVSGFVFVQAFKAPDVFAVQVAM